MAAARLPFSNIASNKNEAGNPANVKGLSHRPATLDTATSGSVPIQARRSSATPSDPGYISSAGPPKCTKLDGAINTCNGLQHTQHHHASTNSTRTSCSAFQIHLRRPRPALQQCQNACPREVLLRILSVYLYRRRAPDECTC